MGVRQSMLRQVAKRYAPEPLLVWRHRRHQRRIVRLHGHDREAGRYIAEHGPTVQAGPFAGMRLPESVVGWEQCAVIPWLRGSYERELHPFLDGSPGLFVDIGAAEGMYLVGMALRGWHSVGFEIDPVRRRRARELAALNGVKVDVRGAFRSDDLDLDGALVLIDIEGAEADLIPEYAERFARSRLVVEFHHGSEVAVVEALERTHSVRVVQFEGRAAGEYERSGGQSWGVFGPS